MKFSELADICGGKVLSLDHDTEITKFGIDSRKIFGLPTECFIAINGVNNDAHKYIPEVAKRGIKNFIIEKGDPVPNANTLVVSSGIDAFQKIARHHRDQFSYPVIGITGSNGKTTVKEWLSELLTEEYLVVKSPKSFNSQVGVPLSVMEMGQHDVAVFEAGLSKGGEMENLAYVIQPTIGIFTTLGQAHEQGFGSKAEKMKEKAKLFRTCEKVICRYEHTNSIQEIERINLGSTFSWSLDNKAAAVHIQLSGNEVKIDRYDLTFKLPFHNPIQIENLMHSVVCGKEIGLTNEAIIKGVNRLKPIPMRLEFKKAINGCQLIDDSYNNDLMGLEIALDFMNEISRHQPKTVILSDLYQSSMSDEDLSKHVRELMKVKGVSRVIHIGEKQSVSDEQFASTEAFITNFPSFSNETILVKGSRNFAFEKVVSRLEAKSHGTILEINLEAIRRNLNVYRALTKKTKLMVMVKALAYGAGAVEIANLLQHEGIDYLGVAYLDEALQLRQHGVTLPIMIMNPEFPDFEKFDELNLEAEVFSLESLHHFLSTGSQTKIHLKIETGMNRLGFPEEDIPALIAELKKHPELRIAGIFTHFSSSDVPEEDEYTHFQAKKFIEIYDQISEAIGYKPLKHAVNSWGIVRFPEYQFDMVRLGIGLYGYYKDRLLDVEPISELKTHISQIKTVKPGDSVGYSRKGRPTRESKIAIIPIGYADGYWRVLGNGVAKVNINGHLVPTIGNICMDMTMIDVTDIPAAVGDEVIVFGQNPTIEQLAKWANTIPYEILTNVSERVKRIFTTN